MLDYGILDGDDRARFDATSLELLGAYTHPYADASDLRIASDLMAILYAIDAVTDAQDTETVKVTRDVLTYGLTNSTCKGASPITLFTQE